MIPDASTSWLRALTSPRGSFSPGVTQRVLAFGVIAVGVWVAHRINARVALSIGHYEVAGAVIALVLAFRTNTSYDRFWEGRRLWGAIVNASRNLARIAAAHGRSKPDAVREFDVWIAAFAHAARRSLRSEIERPEVARLLGAAAYARLSSHATPPLYAARELSERLARFTLDGLDANMTARAEAQVVALVDAFGGCQRIVKTPTPLGYVLLIQRCMVLYLAALPLGLVGDLGALTPLVTMMVAYPVLMIEALGRELDDPFGHEPNDLALSRICEGLEVDLLGSSSIELVMSSTEREILVD